MNKKKNNKEELYYSALDLAIILSGFQLDCCGEATLMEQIWEKERPYFQERYRANKHQLFLDTLFWEHYLYDKAAIDRDFPIVKKDVLENGGSLLGEEDTGAGVAEGGQGAEYPEGGSGDSGGMEEDSGETGWKPEEGRPV